LEQESEESENYIEEMVTKDDSEPEEVELIDESENGILEEVEIKEPLARSLKLTSSVRGQTFIAFGTEITLSSELQNFKDDDQCTFQWEYSVDGTEYHTIDGATDETYKFIYTMENYRYIWRLVVAIEDAEVYE